MSNDIPTSETGAPSGEMRRLLMIGLAAAAVVILFVMTISIILIFALRGDVSALEDQARRTAKATKAMQEELAEIKGNLPNRKSSAGNGAEAKPANIDAADPAHDCVIRPGDKGGLANCIAIGAKDPH